MTTETQTELSRILALARDYGAECRVHGVGFEVIRAYKELEKAIVEALKKENASEHKNA